MNPSVANLLRYQNPADLQREILKEKAERSLDSFIQQAWSVIEPGTTYINNWHIQLIAEYLHAVNDGEIRRLIINIPPRHMKSIEATVCFPVWTWTRHPERRFIKVSYSDSLSRKHNILSRDIINSPWFQQNWGDRFTLKDDVNRQNEFENNHHGMMYSTSVGGAITGNGADIIIIDDPQNPLMANSETERQNSIDFFKNTLQTRLNDPKTGAIIVIMQRLHENDLTGYILSEDLGYTHLCLPAEAEKKTIITFPKSGKVITREEGDPLNPQRFDKDVLSNLKKSMGSLQYAGQFQQVPAPAEGVIFRREWLGNFYSDGAAPNTNDIQSWDMAFTKSEGSAKVAGFVMGRHKSDIYIKDLINEKMTFTESVAAVRTLTGKWPRARAKVVENKAIIPLSPSKSGRALDLWMQAGRYLGVQPYANGDIVGDLTPVSVHTVSAGESTDNRYVINAPISVQPEFNITVADSSDADTVLTAIRSNISVIADEVGGEIAEQMREIFSNMPVKGFA